MSTATKKPLDIFQVLNHISQKDREYIKTLTDEELKAFQPFVIMRWLSGTNSARQIYFLNTLVNPFVFNLPEHKELLYYLMTICTSGKSQRYNWIKGPTKKDKKLSSITNVICDYYKYNSSEAKSVLSLLSREDILSYAEQLGYQTEEITKIKKELKEINNEYFET